MKKSLILSMALTLGVAGTAFAANPFSDVPNDHWSYTSVAKLAQAGVIQGYGDDTFRGDRNLTRYEMAEMVGKAMTKQDQLNAANKATLEKLAAEYAVELKNLGVRVSKLEKHADNVQITGEMQYRYENFSKDSNSSNNQQLRTRLWVTGEVNDNWKAVAMLENISNLSDNPISGDASSGSNISLERAYVEGNFNKLQVTAGRYEQTLGYAMVMDDLFNGIRLDYGDDNAKLGVFYGRPLTSNDLLGMFASDGANSAKLDLYGVEGSATFNKLDVFGQYSRLQGKMKNVTDLKSNIVELGLNYNFTDKVSLMAEYIHGSEINSLASKTNGWATRLNYGDFSRAKKGSYTVYAQYYDIPAGADLSGHGDFGTINQNGLAGAYGTKAWELGVDYAVQKNLQLHFSYGSGKTNANHDAEKKNQLYTYATFYF